MRFRACRFRLGARDRLYRRHGLGGRDRRFRRRGCDRGRTGSLGDAGRPWGSDSINGGDGCARIMTGSGSIIDDSGIDCGDEPLREAFIVGLDADLELLSSVCGLERRKEST